MMSSPVLAGYYCWFMLYKNEQQVLKVFGVRNAQK